MSTKRIIFTPDGKDILDYLSEKTKEEKKSISKTINEIIRKAIDLDDDIYWSKEANQAEIDNEGKMDYSLEEVKKQCGLI